MENINLERLGAMIKEYSQLIKKLSDSLSSDDMKSLHHTIAHFQQSITSSLSELKSHKEQHNIYLKFRKDFKMLNKKYSIAKQNIDISNISQHSNNTAAEEEIKLEQVELNIQIPELHYLGNFDSLIAREKNEILKDIERDFIVIKQIHEEMPTEIVIQGSQLDQIESNALDAVVETTHTVKNLEDARTLQLKYIRRIGCITLIFCCIAVIIIVPVTLVYLKS